MMTYKEDKRTKNLSTRDIHVGDWVQAWDSVTKRYTPPERITAIHDDGTIYTGIDSEQGDRYEYDISEIDALPITPELLLGFGFKEYRGVYSYGENNSLVIAMDSPFAIEFSFVESLEGRLEDIGDISYMHELQQALYNEPRFIGKFNPQWKGI